MTEHLDGCLQQVGGTEWAGTATGQDTASPLWARSGEGAYGQFYRSHDALAFVLRRVHAHRELGPLSQVTG